MRDKPQGIREKTIGIIGGGQLGRMLCIAAGRLGFSTIILEPDPHAPAAQFSSDHLIAGYGEQHALEELSSKCAVITYEFENIPVLSAELLNRKSQVFPPVKALEKSQDRLHEKQFLNELGIATVAFKAVSDVEGVQSALSGFGGEAILKTRRMGYDGKGQLRINASADASQIKELPALLENNCILEALSDFACEISVIGARDQLGNCQCFDAAQNIHKDGILATSQTPENINTDILSEARDITISLMNGLEYVGVIGVEFFVRKDGRLQVNEFAPRVHNSGHWSEAACVVSQFEQHIRAISGMALGSPARHSNFAMYNLIGEEVTQIQELAKLENVLVHDYGKWEIRNGRKMGHYTQIFPLGAAN